jgi:uncharacterized protein (TIGR02117 family)
MKWLSKFIHHFILTFSILFLFYFLFSFLLLLLPVQPVSHPSKIKNPVTFYLFHDFAHTEIIFPAKTLIPQLKNALQPFIPGINQGYLAFSYGDEKFMLNTPKWRDMKFPLALKALFMNTPALLRIGHYPQIRHDKSVVPLTVSYKNYQQLQQNILYSFALKEHKIIPIPAKKQNFTNNYFYFQAQKPYNLFYTCNTWTGDMLRHASLPLSYWTPLSYQVVFHFLK